MNEPDITNRELSKQIGDLRKDMTDLRKDMDARQTALQISIAQIITWQKALTFGIAIVIGIAVFLDRAQNAKHNEQSARITRVEERIVSRLEAVFANLPTTTCQCDETKANDE